MFAAAKDCFVIGKPCFEFVFKDSSIFQGLFGGKEAVGGIVIEVIPIGQLNVLSTFNDSGSKIFVALGNE